MVVDGESVRAVSVTSLLDDAAGADEGRERAGVIARATARAAAKYAVTKAVKDKKGNVAGTMAHIGASLMERADIRSWHVLPQTVTLLRVRVSAGLHQVQLEVGEGLPSVDLGQVVVRSGAVVIASTRMWNENMHPSILAVSH